MLDWPPLTLSYGNSVYAIKVYPLTPNYQGQRPAGSITQPV